MELPRAPRVGVDVGSVRVGVARSDPDGLLATPVRTIARTPGSRADLSELLSIVAELSAACVYVGLPRHLSGADSASAVAARDFAAGLVALAADTGIPVQVRLVDERLSTVDATRNLIASGRKTITHRADIDQAAAVVILQSALDVEHAQHLRAGTPLDGAGLGSKRRKPRHKRGPRGDIEG